MLNISLDFNQNDFKRLTISNEAVPTDIDHIDGGLLVRLERFGFSSNNLASALAPGVANVWPQAFAAGVGRLRLPVWGVAEVIDSRNSQFQPGSHFYGCFPMSRFAVLDPAQEPLNRYALGDDPLTTVGTSSLPALVDDRYNEIDLHIVLRPLLMAAFMVLEELIESQFWHCQQILITCASSKTAMGLSYFLQEYFDSSDRTDRLAVVGMTADHKLNFVQQHGHYDQAIGYEAFRQMDQADTVLVDFSGNFQLQRMLLYYLKQRLVHAYALGACHWNEVATGELAASREYFSALDFYYQHHARSADLNRRFMNRWPGACNAFSQWIVPQLIEGPDRMRWVYEQVLAGKSKPESAYLCKL